MMRRIVTVVAMLGVIALFGSLLTEPVLPAEADATSDAAKKASPPPSTPADRVVVMYFHRTQRCPTCLKMGSYSEEAVKTGFVEEIESGKVEFHYIDFQDKKNEAFTKGYRVSGPTLVVARVAGNKLAEFKSLTEIWPKVRDKAAFIEYVQGSVKGYQKK